MTMTRSILFAAVLLTVPAAAFAQNAEQRAACEADYKKLCQGTLPGGGRILACLERQIDKLSDACKKVVVSQNQKK